MNENMNEKLKPALPNLRSEIDRSSHTLPLLSHSSSHKDRSHLTNICVYPIHLWCQKLKDVIPTVIVGSIALSVTTLFLWIVGNIAWRGIGELSWEFLTGIPENAGREGGIAPILVSTTLILIVCMGVALPLGMGTALWLSEFTPAESKYGRLVRRSLDILAGVPSIVFGLFGNAFFAKTLGLGFSILSGGLTLACMVLPILIRSAEVGLQTVPIEYRLAGRGIRIFSNDDTVSSVITLCRTRFVGRIGIGIGKSDRGNRSSYFYQWLCR